MNLHPIQLNFAALINNETLSDITLKATIFNEIKSDENEQQMMNIDDSTDENKFDESNISLISSLDDNEDDENDQDDDMKQVNSLSIKRSIDGSIHCHWDIIRARCIVFDLIFHAMSNNKLDQLATKNNNIFHVDMECNIIHFDVCYDALLIIVKYLYTGLIRRYDYEDIKIARDVVELANILHLDALRTDINGQFLFSRKQLKDDGVQRNDNNDGMNEWRAMKMDSFNFDDWSKRNTKYFFNSNVLYHYNDEMYKNVGSRQLIRINNRTFQISKVIFVSVSEYFKAMFIGNGGSWKESQNDVQTGVNVIEMKQIDADDFQKLQEFLYTFDQTNYYDVDYGKLNDYDFDDETETKHTQKKKELLNRSINALHLSIFFGIDDLRQALLLIIDKYYLCKNTLYPFWNLGYEYQLNDIKELCSNYLARDFGNISCDQEIFFGLNKQMIKEGLSGGKIQVNTDHMIRVLLDYCTHHQTSIQELLPPNTLFNQANKNYVLCNRRAMNLQHLMRL